MSTYQDDVRMRLGDSGRDRAHSGLRDKLHADAGAAINLLEIVDELRKIFDRINIVMRRRRNEGHSSHRMPQAGDIGADLVAWQLTTFPRFGSLGHLDLNLLGAGKVGRGDAEASTGNLLDGAVGPIAILAALEAHRIL